MSGLKYKQVQFKLVHLPPDKLERAANSLDAIDELLYIDVFHGYKKIGRYKLSDARLKFH